MWDPFIPDDARGEAIEEWTIEKDLRVLNDGKETHISRDERNHKSTPDLSLAGRTWSDKTTWQTIEPIGISDHLPIELNVATTVTTSPTAKKAPKWKRSGVDWSKFAGAVEGAMADLPPEPDLQKRVARFARILSEAGMTHVGKTRPGKRTKSWMTPTVKGAIKKRNRLRRTVEQNREEWKQACAEVNEEIRIAKEESWKDLLQGAAIGEDGGEQKLWKIIKSLNGTPDTNSPNEAIINKGKVVTAPKKKANLFANHYAAVSRLTMTKEDRNANRAVKKRLDREKVIPSGESGTINGLFQDQNEPNNGLSQDQNDYTASNAAPQVEEGCEDITMTELNKAIAKMKTKGACGPDDIPPTFLKALETNARQELLEIFNL